MYPGWHRFVNQKNNSLCALWRYSEKVHPARKYYPETLFDALAYLFEHPGVRLGYSTSHFILMYSQSVARIGLNPYGCSGDNRIAFQMEGCFKNLSQSPLPISRKPDSLRGFTCHLVYRSCCHGFGLTFDFFIIGEAYPQIAWQLMQVIRNRLVHTYFSVSPKIL